MPLPTPGWVTPLLRVFGLVFPSLVFLTYASPLRSRFFRELADFLEEWAEKAGVEAPTQRELRDQVAHLRFKGGFLVVLGNSLLFASPPHLGAVGVASFLIGGVASWRGCKLSRRPPREYNERYGGYNWAFVLLGVVASQALALATGAVWQNAQTIWLVFSVAMILVFVVALAGDARRGAQPWFSSS